MAKRSRDWREREREREREGADKESERWQKEAEMTKRV